MLIKSPYDFFAATGIVPEVFENTEINQHGPGEAGFFPMWHMPCKMSLQGSC
jgi:hypothetical protein